MHSCQKCTTLQPVPNCINSLHIVDVSCLKTPYDNKYVFMNLQLIISILSLGIRWFGPQKNPKTLGHGPLRIKIKCVVGLIFSLKVHKTFSRLIYMLVQTKIYRLTSWWLFFKYALYYIKSQDCMCISPGSTWSLLQLLAVLPLQMCIFTICQYFCSCNVSQKQLVSNILTVYTSNVVILTISVQAGLGHTTVKNVDES